MTFYQLDNPYIRFVEVYIEKNWDMLVDMYDSVCPDLAFILKTEYIKLEFPTDSGYKAYHAFIIWANQIAKEAYINDTL